MQLIVLGMHRSGTSVLSRLLNLMGAYFGPEGSSTGANEENPKGFWERRDIRALNDLVLLGSGCDWNRLAHFDIDKVPAALLAEFNARAKRVLLEIDGNRPWFIKEPRLCVLMPLWRPLFEVPVAVHVLRNPVEVAASLHTRNAIPMEAGLALWERYVRSAVIGAEGLPSVVVSHRQLVTDTIGEVDALHRSLIDIGVAGLRRPAQNELARFVDPELYREREDRQDLSSHAGAKQVALYNKIMSHGLSRSVLGSEGKSVQSALVEYEKGLPTAVASEKNQAPAAAANHGGVDAATMALREKVVAREQEAKSLREAFASLQENIRKREAALSTQIVALEKVRADAVRALELEKALAEARRAERALVDECERKNLRISELDARLAESVELRHKSELLAVRHEFELKKLKEGISEREAELEEVRLDVDEARSQALASTQEAASLQAALDDARHELEASKAEVAALRARVLGAEEASASLKRKLEHRTAELAFETDYCRDQSRSLEQRFSELALLTRTLLDREAELETTRLAAEATTARGFALEAELRSSQADLRTIQSSRWYRYLNRIRRLLGIGVVDVKADGGCEERLELIRNSGLFDPDWYLRQYPDVAADGVDPALHYLLLGGQELRRPGPDFDGREYLRRNPDVLRSGMNPLLHYVMYGRAEGRS